MSTLPKSSSTGTGSITFNNAAAAAAAASPATNGRGSPSISTSASSFGASAAAAAAYSSGTISQSTSGASTSTQATGVAAASSTNKMVATAAAAAASAGGQAPNTNNAASTPYFLDRDPESSASAKRRSLVRAGGTASSPDLRTLVYKKAKDLAQATSSNSNNNTTGATTANGASNTVPSSTSTPNGNGNGNGSANPNGSGPVPFPSARSGSVGGLTAGSGPGGSRRPSRDDEYAAASTANAGGNSSLPPSSSATASSIAANSVSLADEVALQSPSLDDKGGTIKGGAFKERMKKTSGFLRRLRGGGGAAAAAAAAAEPMPASPQGLGVFAQGGNSTLRPGKPVPPLPSAFSQQFVGGAPLAATRSASHGTTSSYPSPSLGDNQNQNQGFSLPPAAGRISQSSMRAQQVVSPERDRDLPVPPRPPRRSSRGPPPLPGATTPAPLAGSLTTSPTFASSTHFPSGYSPVVTSAPAKAPTLPSLGALGAQQPNGGASSSSSKAPPPPPPSSFHAHAHRPTYSIDPELDPDVAHFADRAWGDEVESSSSAPLTLRAPTGAGAGAPPTLSLNTSSSMTNGNETVKASPLGTHLNNTQQQGTTPSGTPISSRFASSSAASPGANVSTPVSANPNSVSIVLQRSGADRERRSFSPPTSLASPSESTTATASGTTGVNPLFVASSASTRKMSESSTATAGETDVGTLAERAWKEQEQFARKEKIAEWLGSDVPLNRTVCAAYFKYFDFSNMRVDVAFRRLCDKLFLRAETQQVDRILSAFSQRYWECNPSSVYGSADVVHSIVFSLLLLNTDLHVADIQDRMTRQQFVRNTIAAIQESAAAASSAAAAAAGGGGGGGGDGGSSTGVSSAAGSIYGTMGAAASASGVITTAPSPRPPHAPLGPAGSSTTSLGRMSADARNESSEFVGASLGAVLAGHTGAGGGASTLAAPARPSRRASVRSYQGLFRSGPSSSAVNVSSAGADDGASIASGERVPASAGGGGGGGGGFASPSSTSRGQYPPPVGLNASSMRQRSRSGSGTASLTEVQSAIHSRMWLVDLESQLKDIYNTVKSDQIRLPIYDSRATLSPSFARRGMRNLTVGGPGTGRVSALKRGSIRGIQGLLGSSTTINSEGTTSPVSSMASRSFLDGGSSPHTPATSLSSSTSSTQPAVAAALGFASTLSQSIIKESQDEEASPNGNSMSDEIDDDDLALMGPPWAKEGFLTRKHYYEGPHKRSKEKNWVEVFVVVQKGMLNMFQFNSNPSATIKPSASNKGGGGAAVVGGGNWLANATPLGEFPLAHTLANALPPPGYNRARPHVFALTLPGGIVYLFQAGHEELVQEWVATCNYWAARQSREPLAGGVSNMEYGWNKVLPREFDDGMDDEECESLSLTNVGSPGGFGGGLGLGGAGGHSASYDPSALYAPNASTRAADSRSVRSGRSTRSFRQRAGAALYQNWHDAASLVAPSHVDGSVKDGSGGGMGSGIGGLRSPVPSMLGAGGQSPIHANERIFINEWKAPEAPMVASDLSEEKQLERCAKHMNAIEADLTAHNELRQPMLQLYSPRGSNHAKALANWERKSNHLLQELVKYQCYVESLKNAMRLRAEKHDLKEVDKMLATADEELGRLR
ncbi:hypothetical protein OC842_007218 [Tilletia horrida]|uniref:SEC7 domain-containing protein n=1 Tax=Tilletia horrida TaxID=155126 RepID=A0AAN6JHC2_9BASI|nr:hypothetical protein OC842_007218 [Tilletia horrida]